MQPRKFPDLPLKSPGIKPRLSRYGNHPTSLPSESRNFSVSNQHINQDDDDNQSFVVTPPNPSTPLTPPFSSGLNSDHSVFAPVMIGGGK